MQLELAKGTGAAVGPHEADGGADLWAAAGGAAARPTAVEAVVARPREVAQQQSLAAGSAEKIAVAFEQVARAVVEVLGAVGMAVPAY